MLVAGGICQLGTCNRPNHMLVAGGICQLGTCNRPHRMLVALDRGS